MKFRAVLVYIFTLGLANTSWSQTTPARLNILEAVERAARNFPSVEAAREQVNAATAGIRAARLNYLPNASVSGQVNRATRNNVFGLLLPQSSIPNISGPVLGTDNGRSVWGSAVGILVSWEPFDFGRRRAIVEAAQVAAHHAELTTRRTQFDVETTTAAAFLTLLASEQTAHGAQAAVERARTIARSVKAYVDAKLRPGADLARAETELNSAETQQFQAEESIGIAKANLAAYTGVALETIAATPGRLFSAMPDSPLAPADLENSPAIQEQKALIDESAARLRILERTYRPTFGLEAAGFSRGTGALTTGGTLAGWNGLAPNYFNAAVGFTVNFPLLALPVIHSQEAQEVAIGRSAAATERLLLAEIEARWHSARATLIQARRIAEETPKEVVNARASFEQANAQYRAGLTSIVAVAEAERLLAQAEIDDSLAKLAVWRAGLQIETAQGDISRFLAEASR